MFEGVSLVSTVVWIVWVAASETPKVSMLSGLAAFCWVPMRFEVRPGVFQRLLSRQHFSDAR